MIIDAQNNPRGTRIFGPWRASCATRLHGTSPLAPEALEALRRSATDDNVIVISGKDKGKTGKATGLNRPPRGVFVEGLNMVKRDQRPCPAAEICRTGDREGGLIDIEPRGDRGHRSHQKPTCVGMTTN